MSSLYKYFLAVAVVVGFATHPAPADAHDAFDFSKPEKMVVNYNLVTPEPACGEGGTVCALSATPDGIDYTKPEKNVVNFSSETVDDPCKNPADLVCSANGEGGVGIGPGPGLGGQGPGGDGE